MRCEHLVLREYPKILLAVALTWSPCGEIVVWPVVRAERLFEKAIPYYAVLSLGVGIIDVCPSSCNVDVYKCSVTCFLYGFNWPFLSYIDFSISHINLYLRYLAVFGFFTFIWTHWRPLARKNIQNMVSEAKMHA